MSGTASIYPVLLCLRPNEADSLVMHSVHLSPVHPVSSPVLDNVCCMSADLLIRIFQGHDGIICEANDVLSLCMYVEHSQLGISHVCWAAEFQVNS
jgi:hypothetical protein